MQYTQTNRVKRLLKLSAVLLASFFVQWDSLAAESTVPLKVATANSAATKQNLNDIKSKITEFLQVETRGYPGQVSIQSGAIDPNLKLAPCEDVNVSMPRGSRPWGKTSVAVSCMQPQWTIYVQATVRVSAQYLVAAAPLAQGQVVAASDVMFEQGDLTQLPAGVFTEPTQAIGRTVNMSVNAGAVLRQDILKLSPIVQQGQHVMLVTVGNGFSISAEGQALTKATEGQIVQVKVASGQVISGIARQGGRVEVSY
ncbi:MAG TPA: flagellar basal body P-ring formation chaperone FlgA [Methylophilus sp.]